MQLSSIYNIGVDSLIEPQASKIKILNIVVFITCIIASLYACFFFVQLNNPALTVMNLGFVALYGASMVLNHFQRYKVAKLSFFIVLMLHVLILTVYIFTPSASFHYYYLLLPCGIFLIFDDEEQTEKLFVMVSSSALFFYCHVFQNNDPIVELSSQTENTIYTSAITIIILEIYFVMSIFSRANSKHHLKLKKLATIDPLTGLSNRRTLMAKGEELYQHAKRYQKVFSLLMIDVDHFKSINDTHGHAIGDAILKKVSQTLIDHTRASDITARYGGEEFIVLLPETDQSGAYVIAEQLRQKINEATTLSSSGQTVTCSVSLGLASYDALSTSFDSLLSQADIALYEAKNTGRNNVYIFDETLSP